MRPTFPTAHSNLLAIEYALGLLAVRGTTLMDRDHHQSDRLQADVYSLVSLKRFGEYLIPARDMASPLGKNTIVNLLIRPAHA